MSETKRDYANDYRKPPPVARFKKGQSGDRRTRPKKNLPTRLVAALNEPVFVTIGGEGLKITKREAIIHQLVNQIRQRRFARNENADRHDERHRKEGRRGTAA